MNEHLLCSRKFLNITKSSWVFNKIFIGKPLSIIIRRSNSEVPSHSSIVKQNRSALSIWPISFSWKLPANSLITSPPCWRNSTNLSKVHSGIWVVFGQFHYSKLKINGYIYEIFPRFKATVRRASTVKIVLY